VVFFLTSFFSCRTYREVRATVRQFKPDVAHVHNVFPLISPSVYWALKHERVPIIQTIHNFRFMCPNGLFFRDGHPCELCKTGRTWNAVRYHCYHDSRLLSALYAGIITLHRILRTWRQIDRFIVLTPFTAQKLAEGHITDASKVRILGPSVTDQARQPGSFEQRDHYVVFMGRLSPEKGVDILLDAAAQVPDLEVKILGAGPLEDALKSRAKDLLHVEFLGWVGDDAKFDILRQARALVVSSPCYETFNLAILDALSVGTAIIDPQNGAPADILQDGVDGLLFTAGDANALSEKLAQALKQPDMLLQMGRRGLEETLPRYHEEVHYRKLLEIQAEVLAHRCVAHANEHQA